MTLQEKLDSVKQSELFKLTFEGKVLGFRVKYFDVNAEKFLYYDFSLETVRDKAMIEFVKSIKNMRAIPLYRDSSNMLLVSKEEVEQKLLIQEFESEADTVRILSQLSKVYKHRG